MNTVRASAILVGLSIIAVTTLPAFAQNLTTVSKSATNAGIVKKPLIQQKLEARKEQQASREAALKAKLQLFNNKIKASATERINTNLNMINQNQTTQMQKHLSTMSTILDKLETRVNRDNSAIASARQAIATASSAVSAQAQKDYTIQVTSENKIKVDAKLQRDALHTDLLTVRKSVIDAKQAVANAIRIAKGGITSGQQ